MFENSLSALGQYVAAFAFAMTATYIADAQGMSNYQTFWESAYVSAIVLSIFGIVKSIAQLTRAPLSETGNGLCLIGICYSPPLLIAVVSSPILWLLNYDVHYTVALSMIAAAALFSRRMVSFVKFNLAPMPYTPRYTRMTSSYEELQAEMRPELRVIVS